MVSGENRENVDYLLITVSTRNKMSRLEVSYLGGASTCRFNGHIDSGGSKVISPGEARRGISGLSSLGED